MQELVMIESSMFEKNLALVCVFFVRFPDRQSC